MIQFFDERGIIEPNDTVNDATEAVKATGARTALTTFSPHIFDEMISKYDGRQIASVVGGCDMPLYLIEYRGVPIIVYKSTVGAPAAVMGAEEVFACGIENLVAFGICGALTDVPQRTLIVPTEAYRDEGTSYHYCPAAEKIEITNSAKLAARLRQLSAPTIEGATWTTDALYRETKTRCDQMRQNGCIAVDMECSALQALCNYRNKQFYTFFITADSLAGDEWEPNYLLDIKLASSDSIGVAVAAKVASEL